MAARLFRLRLALLGGTFRGSFGRGLRVLLLLIISAAAAVCLALLPALLIQDRSDRAVVDVLLGSIVLAAVFVVPFFDNRRNLEPRQFAQFPASPGSIASALLVTSWLSWPFLVFAVWLVSLALLRPERGEPAWVTPVAFVGAAIFALLSTRVMSALSKLMAGERHAGAVRTVGLVLLIAALPVAVYIGATAFRSEGVSTMLDATNVLGWTPFGAPFAAPILAAAGDLDGALPRLGVLFGSVIVLLAIWFPLVRASNQRVERPIDPAVARSGLGWFERFPARPSQVIAARELTYWSRDPRYRVALFAIPIAPVFMLIAFWVAGADPRALALVPLPVILLLLAWSQHNDVAMDSTAIWTHVASGTKGRADRAGRLAPVMMIGIPLALIGSSVTVTILGEWRVLPAVVGMNVAVLLVTSGVTSVFSALMPYPTTRPGDSPFAQPQWSGSGSGVAQSLSMVVAIALSVPPVWFAIMAFTDVEFMQNIWALVFGIGYGLVVLVLGILIGGWLFDRSGPELIAVTQVFD
ncbi:MAG: hypothetical protein ACK5LO_16875 [Leucobacter sp.]